MHVYGFNVCKFWDQLKAIVFVLFQLETIPNAFLPGLLSFEAKNFASMIFSNGVTEGIVWALIPTWKSHWNPNIAISCERREGGGVDDHNDTYQLLKKGQAYMQQMYSLKISNYLLLLM